MHRQSFVFESSEQGRQMSCLIANGAVQYGSDRNPTVRIVDSLDLPTERRTIRFSNAAEEREAIQFLTAQRCTILQHNSGSVEYLWPTKLRSKGLRRVLETTELPEFASALMFWSILVLLLAAMSAATEVK